MTEYERGFTDGIKSKVSNAITDTDVQPVNQWIRCIDRMPKDNSLVLIIGGQHRCLAVYNESKQRFYLDDDYYESSQVTHWIPIPEIPQDVPNVLRNMKAADVQPVKRGKWESSQRTIETGTVYCSNCAIEYYISDLQTVGDCNGIVHYCPNCGARMDLGDEKT